MGLSAWVIEKEAALWNSIFKWTLRVLINLITNIKRKFLFLNKHPFLFPSEAWCPQKWTFGASDKVPDRLAASELSLSELTSRGSYSLKFSYSVHWASYFLLSATPLLGKRITRRRVSMKQSPLTIFLSFKNVAQHLKELQSFLGVLPRFQVKCSYLVLCSVWAAKSTQV